MLVHTKMRLTDKATIKNRIKENMFAFKKQIAKNFNSDDIEFIKEIQDEFEEILHDHEQSISSDEAFKNLTAQYTKAGVILRGLRVREGLTQEEFAKIISVTQANLSSMENGNRPIGKAKAKFIATKFDIDYRYLL